MNKTLVEHAETIDAYMKKESYVNEEIKEKYCSLLDTCYFHYNSGFLTSHDKVDTKLLDFIDSFMYSLLPIYKKTDYINFYETRLGKSWRQPYLDTKEIKIFKSTPTIEKIEERFGTTKWWEAAYEDFNKSIFDDIYVKEES